VSALLVDVVPFLVSLVAELKCPQSAVVIESCREVQKRLERRGAVLEQGKVAQGIARDDIADGAHDNFLQRIAGWVSADPTAVGRPKAEPAALTIPPAEERSAGVKNRRTVPEGARQLHLRRSTAVVTWTYTPSGSAPGMLLSSRLRASDRNLPLEGHSQGKPVSVSRL
jgi:hypothetical protein